MQRRKGVLSSWAAVVDQVQLLQTIPVHAQTFRVFALRAARNITAEACAYFIPCTSSDSFLTSADRASARAWLRPLSWNMVWTAVIMPSVLAIGYLPGFRTASKYWVRRA